LTQWLIVWCSGVFLPEPIRSDNGPEFTSEAVRTWIAKVGVKALFIEPGSPWENGYCESFNGKPRDGFLKGETFYTLKEARILVENWRQEYNTIRPHSTLKYRSPAPEPCVKQPPEALPPRAPATVLHEATYRVRSVGAGQEHENF